MQIRRNRQQGGVNLSCMVNSKSDPWKVSSLNPVQGMKQGGAAQNTKFVLDHAFSVPHAQSLTAHRMEHLTTVVLLTSSQWGRLALHQESHVRLDQLAQLTHKHTLPNPVGLHQTLQLHHPIQDHLRCLRFSPLAWHMKGTEAVSFCITTLCQSVSLCHCGQQKCWVQPHTLYPLNNRSVVREDFGMCHRDSRYDGSQQSSQQTATRRALHSVPDQPGLRGDLH